MSDSVAMWIFGPVLAVGSFIATCAALFYAHLAYRSSVKNSEQARAAELTSLRILAKAGLDDAQRSLIALKTDCQANRAEWETHDFRHVPDLGRMQSMFKTTPTDKVQQRGQTILANISQAYSTLDAKTKNELETLVNEARTASLQIMALAGELQGPPDYRR